MSQSFNHWSEAAARLRELGESYCLVTILTVRGSAPRDAGTKMLVCADQAVGTIGGGQLEFSAIQRARELLLTDREQQAIEDFPLGAKLGQCCGGHVSLLFEVFVDAAVTIALFGAGHVGRALSTILAELPVQVRWIDSRAEEFPDAIPQGVKAIVSEHPQNEIDKLPSGAYVLAMTHDHPLDYVIVEKALQRGDTQYLGVIGSNTKSQRFRMRLSRRGFSEQQIASVHCPIGFAEVPGKQPMEVAVSVAAQLIARYQFQRGEEKAEIGPMPPLALGLLGTQTSESDS